LFAFVLLAGACATKSTMQPTTGLQVTAISPMVVSITGGTQVTITGNDFANDATVTVAGIAATNVTVKNSTQLTAPVRREPATWS
jgi:hypothetical protein